ncbi:MAG: hypothetical protein NTV51_14875 [Verrucomicrobia bacterium]|nr:hypothetical protein [Verrucomicrobiota bacterium]
MRPPPKLLLACAAFMLATVYCAYEAWRFRQFEAVVADLLRPLPAPPPARPKPAATTVTAETAPKPAPQIPERVTELIAKAPKGPGGVPLVYIEELFADLPALKAAYSKAAAAQQRLGYGQFIRTVGLSPREEARFLEILANREAVWGDIRASATTQGLARNDPVIAQLDEQNFSETERGLRALLGAVRYDQLRQYREGLDDRTNLFSLKNLVQTSYRSDHPITLDQMNQLAAITTEAGVFNYAKATTLPAGSPSTPSRSKPAESSDPSRWRSSNCCSITGKFPSGCPRSSRTGRNGSRPNVTKRRELEFALSALPGAG